MPGPQKICPRCQTPAPLAAQYCGSCAHQFRTQFEPPDRTRMAPAPAPAAPQAAGLSRRLIAGLIAGGVGLLLAATNPGKADYTSWVREQIATILREQGEENPFIRAFGPAIAGPMVEDRTRRTNLLLCSVYLTHKDNGELLCSAVGALGGFLPLKTPTLEKPPSPTPYPPRTESPPRQFSPPPSPPEPVAPFRPMEPAPPIYRPELPPTAANDPPPESGWVPGPATPGGLGRPEPPLRGLRRGPSPDAPELPPPTVIPLPPQEEKRPPRRGDPFDL